MRNHKNKKSSSSTSATADTRLVPVARAVVVRGLGALDASIKRVETMLREKDYDSKLASHLAYLTEHATGVLRELRQLERHDKKTIDDMSESEVYQVLIDAGWRPPKGWVAPEGVKA